MIKTRFIKLIRIKKQLDKLIMFCITITLLGSCVSHNGFNLQQFVIVNRQLSSIMQEYIGNNSIEGDKALVLFLDQQDTVEYFSICRVNQSLLSKIIFENNHRIVGFVYLKSQYVVILSSVKSKFVFENTFYKYIVPTNKKRQFNFLQFPDNIYTTIGLSDDTNTCLSELIDIPCVVFMDSMGEFKKTSLPDGIYSDTIYQELSNLVNLLDSINEHRLSTETKNK